MSDREQGFRGEDANAGFATPVMDLVAAAVLVAISLWMLVEAWRLPVPGTLVTAPGLLPFLTAATLLLMALVLAHGALARRRLMDPLADRFELPEDFGRTLVLGGIVIVYVLAIELLEIERAVTVAGYRLVIGAFEVVSAVVVTTVLRLYWQRPLWACLLVALGWIAFLSIAFRTVFHIHLP